MVSARMHKLVSEAYAFCAPDPECENRHLFFIIHNAITIQ